MPIVIDDSTGKIFPGGENSGGDLVLRVTDGADLGGVVC